MDLLTSESLWTEVEREESDMYRRWSYAGLELHDVEDAARFRDRNGIGRASQLDLRG